MLQAVCWLAIATFEWKSWCFHSIGQMVCIKICKYLYIKDLFPTPQPNGIFDAMPLPLLHSIKAIK